MVSNTSPGISFREYIDAPDTPPVEKPAKVNKRIITCSDGTWNKPGGKHEGVFIRTNVQKMFEAICNEGPEGIKQVKYYDQGVGSSGSKLNNIIDGITGRGLDDNIIDAYKFIIWNYEQGDEIYLFGFSRGAYTARSLAGLIRTCGLVKNNDLRLIQQAYDIYRDRGNPAMHPDGEIATKFRAMHSQPGVRIKFIGVWDTVGSLGVPVKTLYNKRKYEFHDTTLSSYVDNAYQALAIDEQRKNFKPTLWQQSENVINGNVPQVLEQQWFAGVHSNIGGGYPDESLSDLALEWMMEKAWLTGLAFEKEYIKQQLKGNEQGKQYESFAGFFKFFGRYIRPVMKTPRSNEAIHPSVANRLKNNRWYMPPNISE